MVPSPVASVRAFRDQRSRVVPERYTRNAHDSRADRRQCQWPNSMGQQPEVGFRQWDVSTTPFFGYPVFRGEHRDLQSGDLRQLHRCQRLERSCKRRSTFGHHNYPTRLRWRLLRRLGCGPLGHWGFYCERIRRIRRIRWFWCIPGHFWVNRSQQSILKWVFTIDVSSTLVSGAFIAEVCIQILFKEGITPDHAIPRFLIKLPKAIDQSKWILRDVAYRHFGSCVVAAVRSAKASAPDDNLAYSKSFRMLGTGSFPPPHTFLYCSIDIHQEYQQIYLLQLE